MLLYQQDFPNLGRFGITELELSSATIAHLHAWITHPKARFWGMQQATTEDIAAFYHQLNTSEHAHAYLGLHQDEPCFLLECYIPSFDEIAAHYPVHKGDRGMHMLLAPTEHPQHGFSTAVIRTILGFIFSESAAERVVVEPDVRNEKIHKLNQRVGFQYEKVIQLRTKSAYLGFCTRSRHVAWSTTEAFT